MSTLELVVLVGFISGMFGGGFTYVVINWTHTRFQLGLDYRLSDLEGRVGREVKIRAAEASNKKQGFDKDLLEKIKAETAEPELTLKTWTEKAFKR